MGAHWHPHHILHHSDFACLRTGNQPRSRRRHIVLFTGHLSTCIDHFDYRLGSSKPLSNPRLIEFRFFNLLLADANQSIAATAAQPSDTNSHGTSLATIQAHRDSDRRKAGERLD
jgi:hypothetical protein